MQKFIDEIQRVETLGELENLRISMFRKEGVLTAEFTKLKDLEGEAKEKFVAKINNLKESFNKAFDEKLKILQNPEVNEEMQGDALYFNYFDEDARRGALHPVLSTMDKIIGYFVAPNFSVEKGPLTEDDFHNLGTLSLPKSHPAKDIRDTFYFNDERLLRTHTPPVQIRTILSQKPPVRMIALGAISRRDFDLTHTPMFHQTEGLVVENSQKVSFANLRSVLGDLLHYMFGKVKVCFRPSFFPFTEPSAEADTSCAFRKGCGCRVCKNMTWPEMMGCGVVDPNVYHFVDYKNVSGCAFGLGVECFAMLLYQIPDLRSLYEGGSRSLEQFR